ncbi:putative metallophosphoesterase At3g03305 [Aristolochia californica]|uniref:putative metallophosphoesterase At3g03305 n=1 Tax=Aristolochia californica TaxID=171875 RepID=UPI0035D67F02
MSPLVFVLFFLLCLSYAFSDPHMNATLKEINHVSRSTIEIQGGPDSVVWVVQLSDLHFSVFHPERAIDFARIVGPALALIRPSLVMITGDLTDGKSKDLLTMKQDEEEWKEYSRVMEDVIKRSGLDNEVFYDLRGNHDKFGVPVVGGDFDFFQKYSINGALRRTRNVYSVTLQNNGWKHLFVGFDSTMGVGLRGPTNLFGHPTDQILADLDSELSQWDSQSIRSITKITFGHFPLSFSAATDLGRSLKDVFLKHSISAYLCGHLHTRFGKNLKRHHISGYPLHEYIQLNMHQGNMQSIELGKNCSNEDLPIKEFWEWEIGDWRKSRIMRILAVDHGHVSFVDLDLSLGAKKTIILPTFPIDSRIMQRVSTQYQFECQFMDTSSYDRVRVLVFSETKVSSVVVRIYDSKSGKFELVLEERMKKHNGNQSRGDLYSAPWNWKAFVDPSPVRFWLQIEANDTAGGSTFSQLRPFSLNGITARVDWKWKEFFVMGCQWSSLYHPMLWSTILFLLLLMLVPNFFLILGKKHYTHKNSSLELKTSDMWKCLSKGLWWVLVGLSKTTPLWVFTLVYLLYLMFFPWFHGQVFTETGTIGSLTHRGWMLHTPGSDEIIYMGVPDVMVIVLPHLLYVLLPTMFISGALAAEKAAYRMHYLSQSGKKNDDVIYEGSKKKMIPVTHLASYPNFLGLSCFYKWRWMRKLLIVVSILILWIHYRHCRALVKAYEMNPFLHSSTYCLPVPFLLAYAIFQTRGS